MTILFRREDTTACRSCGAKEAAPSSDGKFDLCEDCWIRFVKYCRYGKHSPSSNTANMWIAKQLFQNAKRLDKFGVAGRCEAITEGASPLMRSRPRSGYQCCCPAISMREGRKVCWQHSEEKSLAVRFVDGGGQLGVYGEFERIVRELSAIDREFLEAAKRAVASQPDALTKGVAT